jgi:hypothetical protein
MTKFFIMLLVVFELGCSSLLSSSGRIQSVHLLDSKTQTFRTTCSGMAETIGSCHMKAKETCEKGYQLLLEKLDSSGVHREITFQCQ